ncbi:unnamed protein product [Brachionus calyciflorus]|uniref:DDE-1 domain-containing protein n=1 Tax=Brachionus calyciflorus TaxID=104777 RepID=A0A813V8N9_9BILA|nr:unnamed protein product [Brachionus calyciflorus]
MLVCYWISLLDSCKEFKPIDLNKCINFLDDAWNGIKKNTIKNCWRHSDILPCSLLEKLYLDSNLSESSNLDNELDELSD